MSAVPDRRVVLASGIFGAVLVLGGGLLLAEAQRLPAAGPMGPGAVPAIAGVLLVAVGVGLLLRARRELPRASTGEVWQSRAGARVLALTGVLVGFAVLLPVLGYVVCTAALFTATALLLGAPRRWRLGALRLGAGRGGVPAVRPVDRAHVADRALGVLRWTSWDCCWTGSPRR